MTFCDACETCSHCSKHGCIPLTAEPQPTITDTILRVFIENEQLTNHQVCERTGMTMKNVAAYVVALRKKGRVERVGEGRPATHRAVTNGPRRTDGMVKAAIKSQPNSVFALAIERN